MESTHQKTSRARKPGVRHDSALNAATKSILVTGCAGFIGSSFVRAFRAQFPRTTIVGIDNLSTGRRDALDPDIIFSESDIGDRKKLDRIFSRHSPEYVFHFAALPRVAYSLARPVESASVNIIGTAALLEAAARYGVRRFIFSSSSALYGNTSVLPTPETALPNPRSPYALQKHVGELLCRQWSALYGLDTVSLRYFNVFGPGQYGDSPYATVIAAWLETLFLLPARKQKKPPFLEGDGSQTRDFCFVDNVIEANIRAMTMKRAGRGDVFNIAGGKRISLREVKKIIEKGVGGTLSLEKRPTRVGDVAHTHADITKARRVLGYRPLVSFEDGIRRTIRWFEKISGKNPSHSLEE